jgi:hypothetical protein
MAIINDEDATNTRIKWMVAACLVLAVVSAWYWWPRWKMYPEVTSRESLQLMKLLYAACNTCDKKRLQQVEMKLAELTRHGKIGSAEQQAFTRVIALARAGNWKKAEEASFRFAEDQVR